MRLSEKEISAIKEEVAARDAHAKVYLFGSRVDDAQKGGDIDLLVFSKILEQEDKYTILNALYDRIGEQKIDLVITRDGSEPFARIAHKQGVLL